MDARIAEFSFVSFAKTAFDCHHNGVHVLLIIAAVSASCRCQTTKYAHGLGRDDHVVERARTAKANSPQIWQHCNAAMAAHPGAF